MSAAPTADRDFVEREFRRLHGLSLMRRPELLTRTELDGAWTRLTARYRRISAARARRAAVKPDPAPRPPAPVLAAASPPQQERNAASSADNEPKGAVVAPRGAAASPPLWTSDGPPAATRGRNGGASAAEIVADLADKSGEQGTGRAGDEGQSRAGGGRRRPRPKATEGEMEEEDEAAERAVAPRRAHAARERDAVHSPPSQRARRAMSRFSTASFAPAAVLLGEPVATADQEEAAGAATAAFLGVSTSWETSDGGMRVRARLAGMGGQWGSDSSNQLSPLRGHGPGHGGSDA